MLKWFKYGMFFLLGLLTSGMIMLWELPTPQMTLGQQYWYGYWDCQKDHHPLDPSEHDDLTPPKKIQIYSLTAPSEPPLRWLDIWKGERPYEE